MTTLGPTELAMICIVGLCNIAIPVALLIGWLFLYRRIQRIEERLRELER